MISYMCIYIYIYSILLEMPESTSQTQRARQGYTQMHLDLLWASLEQTSNPGTVSTTMTVNDDSVNGLNGSQKKITGTQSNFNFSIKPIRPFCYSIHGLSGQNGLGFDMEGWHDARLICGSSGRSASGIGRLAGPVRPSTSSGSVQTMTQRGMARCAAIIL